MLPASLQSLQRHLFQKGQVFRSKNFDALKQAGRTMKGWQGSGPPKLARKQVIEKHADGSLPAMMTEFGLIPYLECVDGF